MMMMVKEKAREEKDRISKRNYWAAGFNLQLFYCCLSYLVDIKIAGKPERRSMKLNAALSSSRQKIISPISNFNFFFSVIFKSKFQLWLNTF